jgi:hypothetical protein
VPPLELAPLETTHWQECLPMRQFAESVESGLGQHWHQFTRK